MTIKNLFCQKNAIGEMKNSHQFLLTLVLEFFLILLERTRNETKKCDKTREKKDTQKVINIKAFSLFRTSGKLK